MSRIDRAIASAGKQWLLPSACIAVLWAQPASAADPPSAGAQAASSTQTMTEQERNEAIQQVNELRSMKQDMQNRMDDFDARIHALESKLGLPSGPLEHSEPSQPSAPAMVQTAPPTNATPQDETFNEENATLASGFKAFMARKERVGTYDPLRGWILVDDKNASLAIGLMTYVRYLNQNNLDPTYVDSFGRELSVERRQDVQLYKVNLQFKGWMFDPKFQYLVFFWTNNAAMGEEGHVAIAGGLRYRFAPWLTVGGGVLPLPTTRSTNFNFPKWLRNDNRVMADEFYRGSYTAGIDASGQIFKGLQYRAMIGNNLSILGVNANELDNKFDTYAATLYWMPTTGEFGLSNGFGDYDYHQKVATFIGGNYTHSTETSQSQPSADDIENSQIRLTDGTLLFGADPFNTGGRIREARYRMASIDLGIKYKGMSLEGQWYWRWVDKFNGVTGFIPVDEIHDNGFALQASAMPIKDLLQPYVTASKIWGANGNPTEYSVGVNVYPFKRREVRWNFQGIRLDRSPVGGLHLPVTVGGKGWVFLSDFLLAF